jgi:hypothetical protein
MSENPYAAPSTPIVSPQKQAIYTKELKSARTILIVVGVIQLLFGIYFMTQVRKTFDEAAQAEVSAMGSGYQVDPVLLEQAWEERKVIMYAATAVPLLLAVFFFVMAALVYRKPVGITLTSLIVFIAAHVADAVMEPSQIYKGILLKIIFIAILWKAYQSAKTARAALA